MTAREKLKADLKNPEMFDKFVEIIIDNCCPSDLGYEENCTGTACENCWDQEFSENAELKELNDALNDIKKQVAIAYQVPEKMLDAPDPISPETVFGQKIIRDDITKGETMTGCKETQCTRCTHREVCALKNDFLEACDAVSGFTYTHEKDGSIIRLSDVPFIRPIELQCKYYQKIVAVPRTGVFDNATVATTDCGFTDNNTYLRG